VSSAARRTPSDLAVAFLRGCYDFVVGDDWRVAALVGAALVAVYLLSHAGVAVWWLLPLCVVAALGLSLRRATRPARTSRVRGGAPGADGP
jgi:hypothetical protein